MDGGVIILDVKILKAVKRGRRTSAGSENLACKESIDELTGDDLHASTKVVVKSQR